MIVGLRVHPFVSTLGMMAALRGLTIVIPNQIDRSQSLGSFPEEFTSGFFKAEISGVYPVPVLVMAVVAAAGVFVLSRTVFGRQVYAIGGNETAARYAGIPVGRVKIIVYTIMGMLAGLSACVYLGYLGGAETGAGNAYELRVIAATVIGGASLMGGRGSALGAVLGAIVIELIGNAMIILDIPGDYYQIVMGAAIIVAVVIDQTKARFAGRGR
jgi:ribose/xylose/arabinose/galactoside ABC-type transport system permease subunit